MGKDVGASIAYIDLLIKSYAIIKKNIPGLKKRIVIRWRYQELLKQNKKCPDTNKLLYQYLLNIASNPYYSKKLQWLPIESIQLFFRIYNTFTKKYLDPKVKFENFFLKNVIYFPINSLRKSISISELKNNILILKNSGLIGDYKIHKAEFFQDSGDKLQSYFKHLEEHSTVQIEEGIIKIVPSEIGEKLYLIANDYQENISEEDFYSVKILENSRTDIVENFFTQDDIAPRISTLYFNKPYKLYTTTSSSRVLKYPRQKRL